ncbi:neurofilament heavy polypeptide-like isoform X1 [Labrus bergylta]|uniref:neurofilament heavy polypeptide-like isoform X1 n=1 Tax=Labrus bergylta TaxID=56723 RepID=UPI0033136E9D
MCRPEMIRLKGNLLPCKSVCLTGLAVLALLSVTGESSCKTSPRSSLLSEENTGGETEPAPPIYRQPTLSFINNPLAPIRRNPKCPFGNKSKLPFISKQKVPNRNKPTVSTRNKLNFSIGDKTKCRLKLNSIISTNNNLKIPKIKKLKSPFRYSRRAPCNKKPNVSKVPIRKQTKCAISKKTTSLFGKNSEVPARKKSKCLYSNKQKVPVKKKKKCTISKKPTVTSSNKPKLSLYPIKKTSKYPVSNKRTLTISIKPRCGLRTNPKVREKTKCPMSNNPLVTISRKPNGLKVPARTKPKCPFSKNLKVPVKKQNKCPISNKPSSLLDSQKVPVRKRTKCPISNNPKVPAREKSKCPFSRNPKVPISNNKQPRFPISNISKCQLKTKKIVPSSKKPNVSFGNKPKMPNTNDFRIKIRFRLRFFISFRPRMCLCRGSAFHSRFPFLFKPPPPQNTPSVSSKFESVICEGRLGQFACPDGQRIQIESAVYGRQNERMCWTYNIYRKNQNTNCRRDVTAILRNMCDHKTLCYIYVDNKEMGGDPCPRTYKYVQFTASCV